MGNSQSFLATPHHAGLIVCDLEAAMQAYVQDFGYNFFQFEVNQNNSSFTGSSPTFSLRLGIGQLGLNFIELIQPVSGTTLYSRHLEEKGPGTASPGIFRNGLGRGAKTSCSEGLSLPSGRHHPRPGRFQLLRCDGCGLCRRTPSIVF